MKKVHIGTFYSVIACFEDCLYKNSCANHIETMGKPKIRIFAPELTREKEFYCKTIDENPVYDVDEVLPINYDELILGIVQIDKNGNLLTKLRD